MEEGVRQGMRRLGETSERILHRGTIKYRTFHNLRRPGRANQKMHADDNSKGDERSDVAAKKTLLVKVVELN